MMFRLINDILRIPVPYALFDLVTGIEVDGRRFSALTRRCRRLLLFGPLVVYPAYYYCIPVATVRYQYTAILPHARIHS